MRQLHVSRPSVIAGTIERGVNHDELSKKGQQSGQAAISKHDRQQAAASAWQRAAIPRKPPATPSPTAWRLSRRGTTSLLRSGASALVGVTPGMERLGMDRLVANGPRQAQEVEMEDLKMSSAEEKRRLQVNPAGHKRVLWVEGLGCQWGLGRNRLSLSPCDSSSVPSPPSGTRTALGGFHVVMSL